MFRIASAGFAMEEIMVIKREMSDVTSTGTLGREELGLKLMQQMSCTQA